MQNKDYHSFVRGTVVKIDGNYLGSVGQHVSLEIDIVDRDFYNQVYDGNYEKALLCYFSYNLRSKGGFWGWFFSGNAEGVVSKDVTKYYRMQD